MMRAGVPAAQAAAGLILLHGRGGSAADILGLASAAGRVAAVAPEAPGRSWWPTSFLAPAAAIEPFVIRGLAAVRAAAAALAAEGIPRDRLWLAGFSQGACLALEAFAREGGGMAGVLAFSGGLVGTADADGAPQADLHGHGPKRFDYAGSRTGARVWIGVHARDPHIPLARVRDSAGVLAALGARVETAEYPGAGHALTARDLAVLADWTGAGG